jgi:hypothetical protein
MAAFVYISDMVEGTDEELMSEGRMVRAEMRAEELGLNWAQMSRVAREAMVKNLDRRSMADLVGEVTREDVNGMSPRQYMRGMAWVRQHSTEEERKGYYQTGILPQGLEESVW